MHLKTALIIDDNEYFRALISEVFELYGFETISYPDPITFLNHHNVENCSSIRDYRFDVILTDNRMPGMNGVDFLALL